jgi:hypothetical protein
MVAALGSELVEDALLFINSFILAKSATQAQYNGKKNERRAPMEL